jgi:hypothetical protein
VVFKPLPVNAAGAVPSRRVPLARRRIRWSLKVDLKHRLETIAYFDKLLRREQLITALQGSAPDTAAGAEQRAPASHIGARTTHPV